MMPWIILAVAVAAVLGLLITQYHHRKQLRALDRLLDAAIADDFRPEGFDETQVSKLTAKLSRYLSSAKLRRGQLEEEQALVRSLISDISHQTKTPVANILLYTELLAEQPELGAESEALAAQIAAGAEKLSFLIDALVKSSRLETGIIQIQPEPGELHTLACRAAADALPRAQAKGITLHLPEEAAISVRYDPKWCAEAVYNILDNAVKYTPAGGSVTISLHDYTMFAAIQIADTGPGIAAEDLPKIFSRFYRSTDAAEAEGVGIGLYLAREIVQKCGGFLHVTSEAGRGAVFSVYLSKL